MSDQPFDTSCLEEDYPAEEGWMILTSELSTVQPLTSDELRNIASMGQPGSYEFGPLRQRGRHIVCVSRSLVDAAKYTKTEEGE